MYDIIIIGCGFAGATAARECSQAGRSVLVLEAKDRVGGRTCTSELDGEAIELGGGYVFWSQPHVWAEINRYGLSLKERPHYAATTSMLKTRFLINGKVYHKFSKKETAQIKAAFQEFVSMATDVFPQPFHPFSSEKYQEYDKLSNIDRINAMELTSLQRAMLLRTSAIQCHNDAAEGSFAEALRWYALANGDPDTYAHSLSRFTMKEGTTHLLNCILNDAKADVRLNAFVEKIEQNDDFVSVFTEKNIFKAKKCIVATSFNVWKNITFTPSLNIEKTALSKEEHAGKGAKIYIQIKGEFKDSRWSAVDEPILSILPHWVSKKSSMLVAFTNPAVPMAFTKENLTLFLKKFNPKIEVLDFKYHDWVSDPHTLGTWCTLKPLQMTHYLQAAQLPEGNVHFAGSDIALGWRGFIDGAIESGVKVAREIIQNRRS
jgi:pseudooxynicotine oxidase